MKGLARTLSLSVYDLKVSCENTLHLALVRPWQASEGLISLLSAGFSPLPCRDEARLGSAAA